MVQANLKQIYGEIELLRNDISVIKHILSQEGELTEEARKRLAAARKTPSSKYAKL